MDDIFLIKIELRIIMMIAIVEIVVYHTLVYCVGEIAAYLSLSVFEFCIMVTTVCTNYQALTRHGKSFYDFDENGRDKLTMTNVLESKSLFWAFERHLKRELSLEHLNFIVAIVHYKRLCEKRNFKFQNQKQKCTLNDCLKSMEVSMQPVCFNDMKNENTLNDSNMWTTITKKDRIVSDGVGSESSAWLKHPSRAEKKNRGSRWLSDPGALLYWIKSNIAPWSDMEDTAFFIFDEYCDRGAPQEINLGKTLRKELIEFFNSSPIGPTELRTIFDSAFDSIMDLLENDSLRRFRRYSQFDRLRK